jgi:hypothetical protein
MFGKRITLFRLFGFAVRVDASWFIIFALITWTLSSGIFRLRYPGLTIVDYWMMGILGAIALFASVILHELRPKWILKGTPLWTCKIRMLPFA